MEAARADYSVSLIPITDRTLGRVSGTYNRLSEQAVDGVVIVGPRRQRGLISYSSISISDGVSACRPASGSAWASRSIRAVCSLLASSCARCASIRVDVGDDRALGIPHMRSGDPEAEDGRGFRLSFKADVGGPSRAPGHAGTAGSGRHADRAFGAPRAALITRVWAPASQCSVFAASHRRVHVAGCRYRA